MACSTCDREASLRQNAAVLRRLITRAVPAAARPMIPGDEQAPLYAPAGEWLTAIEDCLRRETAPHRRCRSCSILLGPGHLEDGPDDICGTCTITNSDAKPRGYGLAKHAKVGRRGWPSSYATPLK